MKQSSYRLTPDDLAIIAQLRKRLGATQGINSDVGVIRYALRRTAQQEGITMGKVRKPNRADFAATAAAAYVRQFGPEDERHPVMNDMVVTYDLESGEFGMQSSLSPFQHGVVDAMYLSEGCFGDTSDTETLAADIAGLLLDSASDEGWHDVLAAIEVAREDTGTD